MHHSLDSQDPADKNPQHDYRPSPMSLNITAQRYLMLHCKGTELKLQTHPYPLNIDLHGR